MKLFSVVAIGKLILSVALLLITAGCSGGSNSGGSYAGGSNGTPPPPPTPAVCNVLASNLNIQGILPHGQSAGFVFTAQPVLDSTNVYWVEFDTTQGTTGGSIRTIPKKGGQVMVLASGLSGVNDIELDSTNVYWTEYDINSNSGNGAIKTVAKTGGAITVLATGTPPGVNGDVSFPAALAVDSTFVYWHDINPGIRRVPKTGGTVVELAGSPLGAERMTFDAAGTNLYFDTGSMPGQGTTVGRWAPSGGPVQVLASGVGSNVVGGIALDGNFFYGVSTDAPNGNVFEVPIGGGAPIYVVQNLYNPHNVAIDASNIYYAPGTGGVFKVPKTGV